MIPFEALVTQRGGTPRYWLDEGPAIRYGVSATSLIESSRRGARPVPREVAPVLSVTDVSFAGGNDASGPWSPLPGTARETAAIQTAFGESRVTVLRGHEASESAVRREMSHRRYLHLATHGYVRDGRNHLLAGLVLAVPASPVAAADDGLLELQEVYQLKLDCELAVLSACETQRGRQVAGEGAFALSRGFLAAGARRVVASQWPVADEPTAEIVGTMFAALAADDRAARPLRPDLALRDGKRRVRANPKWSDPFYWAPMVLNGP
jgi:CHAT domain-containing protein